MEPKYLDDNFDHTNMKAMDLLLDRLKPLLPKDIPTKKRGGLNEITDLRTKTAEMLNKPIEQVYGLTRNWTVAQLYELYNASQKFVNPPALWWVLYKKKKNTYGKKKESKKGGVCELGQKRRRRDKNEGQGLLFNDW